MLEVVPHAASFMDKFERNSSLEMSHSTPMPMALSARSLQTRASLGSSGIPSMYSRLEQKLSELDHDLHVRRVALNARARSRIRVRVRVRVCV